MKLAVTVTRVAGHRPIHCSAPHTGVAMTLSTTRNDLDQADYDDVLRRLSEASVDKHFDPYVDIAWDSPEFAVTPNDPRWILNPQDDPLGSHPWYQALP